MAQQLLNRCLVPDLFSQVTGARSLFELVCIAFQFFFVSAALAQPAAHAQANQEGRALSSCLVLEAVRDLARDASKSDLARARKRLDIERVNTGNLPQLSALWRDLPGGVEAERELEVMVSIPLGTVGKRQAEDEVSLTRLKEAVDLRIGFASLLKDALSLYYELKDTMLAHAWHAQVRSAWMRTIDLLQGLPKHGPERNLLQATLLIEQDRLDQELETLEQRRSLLEGRLESLLGPVSFVVQDLPVMSETLQVSRGTEPGALRKVGGNKGPQLWRSALASLQLQTGVTTLWTREKARLGYFLGMSYSPVAPSAFRALRMQTRVQRLEREEQLRMFESRRKTLEHHRGEKLLANQKLMNIRRTSDASRAKQWELLEQTPSQISLAYLTHRVELIRSGYRRDRRELRALDRVRAGEVRFLESHAIVSGLESIRCTGIQARNAGVVSPTESAWNWRERQQSAVSGEPPKDLSSRQFPGFRE